MRDSVEGQELAEIRRVQVPQWQVGRTVEDVELRLDRKAYMGIVCAGSAFPD